MNEGSVKIWDVRQKEKPVAVIEPGNQVISGPLLLFNQQSL